MIGIFRQYVLAFLDDYTIFNMHFDYVLVQTLITWPTCHQDDRYAMSLVSAGTAQVPAQVV